MQRTQKLLGAAAVAAVFAATGCASLNTMQTANTLGAGKMQFALEPAYEGAAADGVDTQAIPRFDLAMRYGVTDTVDIGGRVGASGFEFQGKFQLTPPGEKAMVMSLAPSVGGFAAVGEEGVGIINFAVPFLIGFEVGNGSQLVLGPKLIDMLLFEGNSDSDTSGSVNLLFVGATIGFSLKLGDSFRLMPELGLAYPVVGTASASSGNESVSYTDTLGGGVMFQFGLGLLFGG